MAKQLLINIGLVLLFTIIGKAQNPRCNTDVDFTWLQINAPDRYQRFQNVEASTNNYNINQNQATNRLINGNGLIVIPVVVHVLHHGEPVGSGYKPEP